LAYRHKTRLLPQLAFRRGAEVESCLQGTAFRGRQQKLGNGGGRHNRSYQVLKPRMRFAIPAHLDVVRAAGLARG
jgi:hypothetical protein